MNAVDHAIGLEQLQHVVTWRFNDRAIIAHPHHHRTAAGNPREKLLEQAGLFLLADGLDDPVERLDEFRAGQDLKFSGRFAFDGTATNVVKRSGKVPIVVVWSADQLGADQITGMITGPYWESPLLGYRDVYAAKTSDAPQAGRYTMLFPGVPGSSISPEGDGSGTVTVNAHGATTLAGTLADGTKVSQAARFPGSVTRSARS